MNDDRSQHPWFELSAYIDGQLDEVPAARVDAHLRDCEPCRIVLADLRRISAAVGGEPVPEVPDSLAVRVRERVAAERTASRFSRRAVSTRPFALAAAASVCLVAFAAILLRTGLLSTDPTEAAGESDAARSASISTPSVDDGNKVAAGLEKRVNDARESTTRTETARERSAEARSPDPGGPGNEALPSGPGPESKTIGEARPADRDHALMVEGVWSTESFADSEPEGPRGADAREGAPRATPAMAQGDSEKLERDVSVPPRPASPVPAAPDTGAAAVAREDRAGARGATNAGRSPRAASPAADAVTPGVAKDQSEMKTEPAVESRLTAEAAPPARSAPTREELLERCRDVDELTPVHPYVWRSSSVDTAVRELKDEAAAAGGLAAAMTDRPGLLEVIVPKTSWERFGPWLARRIDTPWRITRPSAAGDGCTRVLVQIEPPLPEQP